MHILFIHRSFPAQFGPIANVLAETKGWRSTFLSRLPPQTIGALTNIQYQAPEDDRKHWDFAFQFQLQESRAVVAELAKRPDLKPDLVVAHSGFGSSHLVPTVLRCPIINYFEYYTQPLANDMLFRREWRHEPWYYHWRRTANAMTLLDLQTCDAGYSPTHWQRATFPKEYLNKIDVLFDGIDTAHFNPRPAEVPREICGHPIPEGTRIVTYVARGFELIRGFDIFMKVAKRIYKERPNTLFLIAGKDRVCYGTDTQLIGGPSLKEWVLKRDDYDLSKFLFLDWVPPEQIARLFHLSDLHLFLTTPFVLSWSLLNAMACGTTVLASNVAPVREMIRDGENGLLMDFYDVDGIAKRAIQVLDDPAAYHFLGKTASAEIESRYSLTAMRPKFVQFFERVANR